MKQVDLTAFARIADYLFRDELKHWEECGKPKKHIYHDVVRLRAFIIDELAKKHGHK